MSGDKERQGNKSQDTREDVRGAEGMVTTVKILRERMLDVNMRKKGERWEERKKGGRR